MASAAVSDEGALRMQPTPCGCTSARAVHAGFTGICGEFVGSQRADVGIGPYKVQYMNKTGRVFRK